MGKKDLWSRKYCIYYRGALGRVLNSPTLGQSQPFTREIWEESFPRESVGPCSIWPFSLDMALPLPWNSTLTWVDHCYGDALLLPGNRGSSFAGRTKWDLNIHLYFPADRCYQCIGRLWADLSLPLWQAKQAAHHHCNSLYPF